MEAKTPRARGPAALPVLRMRSVQLFFGALGLFRFEEGRRDLALQGERDLALDRLDAACEPGDVEPVNEDPAARALVGREAPDAITIVGNEAVEEHERARIDAVSDELH